MIKASFAKGRPGHAGSNTIGELVGPPGHTAPYRTLAPRGAGASTQAADAWTGSSRRGGGDVQRIGRTLGGAHPWRPAAAGGATFAGPRHGFQSHRRSARDPGHDARI